MERAAHDDGHAVARGGYRAGERIIHPRPSLYVGDTDLGSYLDEHISRYRADPVLVELGDDDKLSRWSNQPQKLLEVLTRLHAEDPDGQLLGELLANGLEQRRDLHRVVRAVQDDGVPGQLASLETPREEAASSR